MHPRTLRTLLAVFALTLGTIAVAGPATAATVTTTDANGIQYQADDTNVAAGATISSYTGASTTVNIPDTIEIDGTTYDVTTIGDSVFKGNGLTALNLGNSITTIPDFAFADNSLTSVTIPDSVTTIGYAAFEDNALTSLDLGNSVTTIDSFAFNNNRLTSVTIPDSVTRIKQYAFYRNGLTGLDLGSSVTTIDSFAFNSSSLTSVTIPDSVTTIGNATFGSNLNLTDVTFVGPPPTTISGAGDADASLGNAVGLVVTYNAAYDDSTYPGGFTTPTWHGYSTQTIQPVTVSFDLRGHGDPIPDQNVTAGDTATQPTPPTASGWTFTSWYTSPALATEYDFSTPLTADLTLYAGWTAASAPDPGNGGAAGGGSGTDTGSSGGTGDDSCGGTGDDAALPDTGSPISAPWLIAILAVISTALTLIRRRPTT